MLALVAVGLLAGVITNATASTISLATSGRGWISQNGSANGSGPSNNFLVGNCGADDCMVGEFRDFFTFSIPIFPAGQLASATLIIPSLLVILRQAPTATVTFTSGSGSFGALGTGTVYGAQSYVGADSYGTRKAISLNAAALADIASASGGSFTLSGRVTSPTTFSPSAPDQFIFGASGGQTPDAVRLVLETVVPVPGAVWLFASAVALTGLLRQKIAS
jgi:hypothetical protein